MKAVKPVPVLPEYKSSVGSIVSCNKSVYVRNSELYSDASEKLSYTGLSVSEFLQRCLFLYLHSKDYGLFYSYIYDKDVIAGCRTYPEVCNV